MLGLLFLSVLGAVVFLALRLYLDFRKQVEAAKKTGFPYITIPIPGLGFEWSVLNQLIAGPLRAFPYTSKWRFLDLNNRQDFYQNPRVTHNKYGDSFLTVAPTLTMLKTSNAELQSQITTRKNDFPKPVDRYGIINIFGKSIVTVEGQDWRRHRKVVGPSFSERSNKLVFEESLRQARAMMEFWISQGSNTVDDIKVEHTAAAAATLSLHVICAAGFGLPQIWPGESESKLDDHQIPGLSPLDLSGNHSMTFKQSMRGLLQGLRWIIALPPWVLKHSPFEAHKNAYRAYDEIMAYFNELVEIKKKQMYFGEHDDNGTMDLMGPMIRASDEAPTEFNSKSQTEKTSILSRSELIGNSFIFFFAGHETSANSIHFSIVLLAINLASQQLMQTDIDEIFGLDKPSSDFSYQNHMPRLYNSMVGAVLNEQLRLVPAILSVPKVAKGDQTVTVDGREFLIADGTFIQLNVVGTNRNPRYWPSSPSKITPGTDDLNDFVPERWLPSANHCGVAQQEKTDARGDEVPDGLEQTSFDTSSSRSLFKPVKGSFITFSEGMRACPGRRFAQVEVTAVLTAIFQKWSVELDVSEWASDEEVKRMGQKEKAVVYGKAVERAREIVRNAEQNVITLQMRRGEFVPVRFVARGRERFAGFV